MSKKQVLLEGTMAQGPIKVTVLNENVSTVKSVAVSIEDVDRVTRMFKKLKRGK